MKILFAVAHPDDEAYGPYGTIVNLVKQGHSVSVYCLCNGKRPTAEEVSEARVLAFKTNCNLINVNYRVWDNDDLSLELNSTAHLLTDLVNQEQFDVIYTHSRSDINHDHQVLAEACLIAARPKPTSSVKKLYYFEVPSSSDWGFHKIEPVFQPNVYSEISNNVMSLKTEALSRYQTEIYNFPDARSIEAVVTLAKYRGYQVGYHYAEAFQLVFDRDHKN